jgi:hypothetical protein
MNKATANQNVMRQRWTNWQKAIIAFLVLALLCTFIAFPLVISSNLNFQNIALFPTSAPTQDWRKSPYYVSETQFGKDWPLTVNEGLIRCDGGGVLIDAGGGIYGLTGFSNTLGYTNIKDSGLLKRTDDGWGMIPISKLVSYAVDLCNK